MQARERATERASIPRGPGNLKRRNPGPIRLTCTRASGVSVFSPDDLISGSGCPGSSLVERVIRRAKSESGEVRINGTPREHGHRCGGFPGGWGKPAAIRCRLPFSQEGIEKRSREAQVVDEAGPSATSRRPNERFVVSGCQGGTVTPRSWRPSCVEGRRTFPDPSRTRRLKL